MHFVRQCLIVQPHRSHEWYTMDVPYGAGFCEGVEDMANSEVRHDSNGDQIYTWKKCGLVEKHEGHVWRGSEPFSAQSTLQVAVDFFCAGVGMEEFSSPATKEISGGPMTLFTQEDVDRAIVEEPPSDEDLIIQMVDANVPSSRLYEPSDLTQGIATHSWVWTTPTGHFELLFTPYGTAVANIRLTWNESHTRKKEPTGAIVITNPAPHHVQTFILGALELCQ